MKPEADARAPEIIPEEGARAEASPEQPQDPKAKLVCGRLVPVDRA